MITYDSKAANRAEFILKALREKRAADALVDKTGASGALGTLEGLILGCVTDPKCTVDSAMRWLATSNGITIPEELR